MTLTETHAAVCNDACLITPQPSFGLTLDTGTCLPIPVTPIAKISVKSNIHLMLLTSRLQCVNLADTRVLHERGRRLQLICQKG